MRHLFLWFTYKFYLWQWYLQCLHAISVNSFINRTMFTYILPQTFSFTPHFKAFKMFECQQVHSCRSVGLGYKMIIRLILVCKFIKNVNSMSFVIWFQVHTQFTRNLIAEIYKKHTNPGLEAMLKITDWVERQLQTRCTYIKFKCDLSYLLQQYILIILRKSSQIKSFVTSMF